MNTIGIFIFIFAVIPLWFFARVLFNISKSLSSIANSLERIAENQDCTEESDVEKS